MFYHLLQQDLYERCDQLGLELLYLNSQVITLPYWVPLGDTCDINKHTPKYYTRQRPNKAVITEN